MNNASVYRASRKLALERKWMVAFQHATINFFTYGFPVSVVQSEFFLSPFALCNHQEKKRVSNHVRFGKWVGIQICMVGLICWSFMHVSLCAFGLLAYVGYVLIVPPSVITLLHLNSVLLGFILIWALSIYVFNAAFVLIMDKFDIVR